VPFLIPTSPSLTKGRLLLGMGIAAYQVLCAGTASAVTDPALQVPRNSFLSRHDLLARYPVLAGVRSVNGAWVINEAHLRSSERMTLAFVKTAARNGAVVANHVSVERVIRDGPRVTGVAARDELTGRTLEIGAHVVANAAGPWIGGLNAGLGHVSLQREITAFSKGVHLVTRSVLDNAAVAVATRHRARAVIQRGGRHLFVIPWRGCSLIGTSNVPFDGSLDDVRATAGDVTDFLADINDALPSARLGPADVHFAFAGLYPLTEKSVRPEVYQGTGFYQLVDHARSSGLDGLVSVLGAKYTTARRLAEQAVDLVGRKLQRTVPPCRTATTPLSGGDIEDLKAFRREAVARHARIASSEVVEHLVGHYGTELDAVLQAGSVQDRSLDPMTPDQPTVEAEVRHAVRHEMAMRLDDIVFRRTGLGTIGHPGRACLERCAAIAASHLGWDDDRRRTEIDQVEQRFSTWCP
jgi:glycerol-3-phosphate dehydrogenase